MSERGIHEYLQDIREALARIDQYTAGISYEEFIADGKTQDAVIRNLEIIGEAAKNISADFRNTHATIPWHSMMGVRNRLIHDYFGVNLDIVWQIVSVELLNIQKEFEKVIP